ncbi:MAG TPA: hypothetical protein VF633_03375 [Brevundimonas sp.]|jgi:hypothetical protein
MPLIQIMIQLRDKERFPNPVAIAALAERFNLPNDSNMQDWEYVVADLARLDEFLAYAESCPDEDEAFVLIKLIFQSFEDLGGTALEDPRWARVDKLLNTDFELHLSTLRYWASADQISEDGWHIAPLVRSVIASHGVEKLSPS